ncbi:MAG TPA: cytochrome c oxidase subunit 4 [Micrococcaceae bacterium]|jgi:disulfide bond formation protein DsbB|nr:cytochrome c oxidase subunit 4 [Micrococcaceae bacterium]
MKVESWLFGGLCVFFVIVGIVYGIVTHYDEWVGSLALLLVAGLAGMIGFYLYYTGKRVGSRPEDRHDAEIHEGAGEQGHFSPWSWWPLVLGVACATGFLGVALAWWIVFIAGGLAVVALVGWVFEYSRGDHAH